MKRTIVACISDTHANSKLGLLSPHATLWDENAKGEIIDYNPALNAVQEQLWDWYLNDKEEVRRLADGDDIVLIHNGDMTHGSRFLKEVVGTRIEDQLAIAEANIRPWLNTPGVKHAFFVKGTASHEFGEGSAPMSVARSLRGYYDFPIEVPYHVEMDIDGYRIDAAHHGAHPGTRNWLKGRSLMYYTQDIMTELLMDGRDPPHAILRGHYHQYVSEIVTCWARGKNWRTYAAVCPAYGFPDSFARKVARSPGQVWVGCIALELVDGKLLKEHPFVRKVDFRTKRVID